MTDATTNARLRREIYDLFSTGINPTDALPTIDQMRATYGNDAVDNAIDELKAIDSQPIHRL